MSRGTSGRLRSACLCGGTPTFCTPYASFSRLSQSPAVDDGKGPWPRLANTRAEKSAAERKLMCVPS